jgi:membrane protease YdiL (CAAX protease family)
MQPPVPPSNENEPIQEAFGPSPEPESARFPFWGLADVGLFLGLAVPVFIVAYSLAFAPMLALGVASKGVRLLVPQFTGYVCALIPLWVVFRSRYGRSPLEALRVGTPPRVALASFPAGVAVAFGILMLGVLLRTPPIESPMQELLEDPVSLVILGVLASTIGPVFEEMFFRGLLQPVLTARLGVVIGIVLAALPFALLHGPQYAWSWRHVLLITAAGSAFGWQRYRYDSTGAAAVMHAAYNLTLFVGFLIGRAMQTNVPQAV